MGDPGNLAKVLPATKIWTELSKQLSDLKKVGMGDDAGLNLLVDFIVYMALEDITFFRFLDFNEEPSDPDVKEKMGNTPCERFLSWIDYEYLSPKGSKQETYRNIVNNMLCEGSGKVITNALTPWTK